MARHNINDPVNARLSNIELKLKQHNHDVSSLRQGDATDGDVLTWSDADNAWVPAASTGGGNGPGPGGGGGGGSSFIGNLDGGEPDTNFGGISPIDLGGV